MINHLRPNIGYDSISFDRLQINWYSYTCDEFMCGPMNVGQAQWIESAVACASLFSFIQRIFIKEMEQTNEIKN